MQNQQLVDYIKQQLQGGVQKDAVKKALLDAGWPQADVDDSVKAAEPAGAAAAATTSPAVASPGFNLAASMTAGGQGAQKGAADVKSFAPKETAIKSFGTPDGQDDDGEKPRHSWTRIAMSVMGAVIVILLGAMGYVYYSLNGKISAASGESASAAGQAQTLQQQLLKFTDDNAALSSQIATLRQENQGVMDELLFFSPDKDPAADYSLTGAIGGTTGAYTLTTAHHILISVKNSKDAKVIAALGPLVGQNAMLTGKRTPGIPEITISAVNGAALVAATTTPPAATSSTP